MNLGNDIHNILFVILVFFKKRTVSYKYLSTNKKFTLLYFLMTKHVISKVIKKQI